VTGARRGALDSPGTDLLSPRLVHVMASSVGLTEEERRAAVERPLCHSMEDDV
jgi:hypothetical protein